MQDGASAPSCSASGSAESRRGRGRWLQGDKTVPLPPGWGWLGDQPFPLSEAEEFKASLEPFLIRGDTRGQKLYAQLLSPSKKPRS